MSDSMFLILIIVTIICILLGYYGFRSTDIGLEGVEK